MFVSLLVNARCAVPSLSVVPVVEQKYPSFKILARSSVPGLHKCFSQAGESVERKYTPLTQM
jgi:hypothetical protein